jgi:UDP-GlcNAc:undecaprenyl-phosphate/decaprenyl-phosphate GlcNAc-1-phosphate transferase
LSDWVVLLTGASVAFLLSWLVHPHFRSLGFLTGIVDHPGYRRPHAEPVPRTGGMAIFISFFITLLIMDHMVLKDPLPWTWLGALGGSGLALLALGVGDDRFHIHAEKKLYGQLIVIMGLMISGMRLHSVFLPFMGEVALGGWAWPLTLFWYLGFINSMNLIDGLDGLASGISSIALFCILATAFAVGDFYSQLFSAILIGAILAFLYWNVSKRKIFLGDSGSMWLGLALASLFMHLGTRNHVSLTLLLAPMVVPIWDTGTTIIRRYRKRVSVFEADDYHLHHRLIRLGFTPAATVRLLLVVTMGSSLFALSDVLNQAWLGLPALACWLWPVQIWGSRRSRQHWAQRMDFFSEILFVMGFDDSQQLLPEKNKQVAEIIDIQAERNGTDETIVTNMSHTTGKARVIRHPGKTAKDSGHKYGKTADGKDVLLTNSSRTRD